MTYIIAEIGINHNGSETLCRKLISNAKEAGADAVKFQKRTIDVVYSAEELSRPRDNPFGSTNGDLKRGLEFGYKEYLEIVKNIEVSNEDKMIQVLDEYKFDAICDLYQKYSIFQSIIYCNSRWKVYKY